MITRDSFIGEYNIGQKSSVAVQESLDWFIGKYTKDYLIRAFGNTFYDYFNENADTDGNLDDFKELLYDDYESPLVAYIFYWYTRNESSKSSGIGQVKPKALNSDRTPEAYKAVSAWNNCVEYTLRIRHYLISEAYFSDKVNTCEFCPYIVSKLNVFDI